MKRIEIIERLYELRKDYSDLKIDSLLDDILSNKLSDEDAELKLREIDPQYVRSDFLKNLKGKPVYKNIIEYKRGNLTNIQIAKMISSLMTQVFIQAEHDDTIEPSKLQFDSLLDILKELSILSNPVDTKKIDALLSNYGWDGDDGDSI